MQTFRTRIPIFPAAALILAVLAGCAGGPRTGADEGPDRSALERPANRYTDLSPVQPQPKPGSLKPGLAVMYHHHYFARSLDPLTEGYVQDKPGDFGQPVRSLNHKFGRDEVFDSGAAQGVGVRMQGLLNFPESGKYTFHAVSNDGLRVYLDDTVILEDPSQHSDRYAVPAEVMIAAAGWYPFKLEYFQRKGTATLQLFRRGPDSTEFTPVPPEALAHRPADVQALQNY